MLESPTVVESVFERRPLTYTIDENGFRNRFPVEDAGVLALGDSFAVSASTDEGSTWIDHLSDIERSAMDATYVEAHPNRHALDRTSERMKSLSDEFGFRVTVLIAR